MILNVETINYKLLGLESSYDLYRHSNTELYNKGIQ